MILRVYSNLNRWAEKNYALEVLLEHLLGIPFQLLPGEEAQTLFVLPSGAQLVMEDAFSGDEDPALFKAGRFSASKAPDFQHPFEPADPLPLIAGLPYFSHTHWHIDCGLDLAASAYFMLSRWEEQLPGALDEHGRFPLFRALAYRSGFYHRPVVQEYAGFLWEMLQKLGWPGQRKVHPFELCPSHDVDHPWLWATPSERRRTIGGSLIKRKNLQETRFWLRYRGADPFDTFDWLMDISEQAGVCSQFNFLGRRKPDSDCYYPLDHPFILNTIQKITARGHRIGFHASYESLEEPTLFPQELASLQALTTQAIRSGRQHYLRFKTPETWRMWAEAGLDEDSTLGYPETPGFRCGMAVPFPVFDCICRNKLPLLEKPLLIMDVGLALNQPKTPEQGLADMQAIRRQVAKHGGCLSILWHNSSLNDFTWQAWKRVYQTFMTEQ